MGWLNPNCPSCGKPMTAAGWYLKDGLKCERCYKKLRKAKKRKNRQKRWRSREDSNPGPTE